MTQYLKNGHYGGQEGRMDSTEERGEESKEGRGGRDVMRD